MVIEDDRLPHEGRDRSPVSIAADQNLVAWQHQVTVTRFFA